VFGNGNGAPPKAVSNMYVLRTEKDKRSAYIKWQPVDNAFAYNLYYGTAPDKLYSCIMIHDVNEYWFKAMDKDKKYYFTIEAINENGISEKLKTMEVE
jgi:xylan 1,4-beta-xylosidase